MTREEAISLIKSAQLMLINPTTNEPVSDLHMALFMAIQALEQNESAEKWYKLFVKKLDEQESCDDAISRQDAIDAIYEHEFSNWCDKDEVSTILNDLPSVTHKSGKWIDYSDEGYVECPFCEHATTCEDNIDELHYCFFCGARMVEPQESEDKE